jgi:hypothetical protein
MAIDQVAELLLAVWSGKTTKSELLEESEALSKTNPHNAEQEIRYAVVRAALQELNRRGVQ